MPPIKSFFIPLIFLSFVLANSNNLSAQQKRFLEVEKVVDGDTFWVINLAGHREKVRLIGVDTPEVRRTRNKEIGFYGREASDYVKSLLFEKKVRLEYDVAKYDRYKRTLAYVFLEDGTFLNALLVEQGYATLMTVPPNVKHADLFLKLQRKARENEKGLWKLD